MTGAVSSGAFAAREAARRIFLAGLEAADPAGAVRRALEAGPGASATVAGERFARPGSLRVVAVGKAAAAMARACLEVLPEGLAAGPALAVAHDEGAAAVPGCRLLSAGHPLPDERGARAALEVESLVSRAGPEEALILLLSGGASALLPAPAPGISLEDKAAATRRLLIAGADIGDLNAVRKHLSRLKGGRLAEKAAPAAVEALIVSDVIGDDVSTIGSGPTAPDPTTYADALEALSRRGVLEEVPAAVRRFLERGRRGEVPETPKPGSPVFRRVRNRVVAGSATSLERARAEAERLGLRAEIVSRALSGEAREAGAGFARRAAERLRADGPLALLAAGETTVTVKGSGLGGRNQELALAFALEAERLGLAGPWAFLSAGTDGRDGPTDAAGAVVDPGTLERGRRAGADPEAALAENDSYRFFERSGDLFRTGPTGTNVADLQVLVAAPAA